eukprot:m.228097 g.228097  ORF g.228097 m.228097 type:complete len:71 (-) comp33537_c0_seq1:56-268(-)
MCAGCAWYESVYLQHNLWSTFTPSLKLVKTQTKQNTQTTNIITSTHKQTNNENNNHLTKTNTKLKQQRTI